MIAIICAMENEISYYKSKIQNMITTNILNQEFLTGTIGENKVVLTKCGIGKVNSAIITTLLIQNFNPKLIINTGIAGGVAPVNTSDLFIANNFIYGDFNLEVFGYEKGQVPGMSRFLESSTIHTKLFKEYLKTSEIDFKEGLIVTQDIFVTSSNKIDKYDSLVAIDMEGASICHTCNLFKIPFISIRIISDIIDSKSQIDNYSDFEDEAAKLSGKITYKFLKNTPL